MASFLVRRSDSACALPRPSATASARLANSTVNHSQAAVPMEKPLGLKMQKNVESSEPTQTTIITGLRSWWRGFSLRSASGKETTSCLGLKTPALTRCAFSALGCLCFVRECAHE